jgi:D-psicose/D-tagatose/L-ribulose 3-epimerase
MALSARRLRDNSARVPDASCIGLTSEYDFASEDASVRRRGIEFLKKGAEMVREVGGTTLSGIIHGMWPGTLDERQTSKPSAWRYSVASMREAAKPAEANGVVFNVEVVNRFEQFLMNTCEEALAYVGEVGSPNVKILLDTFHLNIEKDSIGGAIEQAGDRLGHFHIGENNRRPPGYGHVPWDEVAAALKRICYRGAVVMEPFLVPGGEVGCDIKVFRNMAVGIDMDREAGKALRFIRGKLA